MSDFERPGFVSSVLQMWSDEVKENGLKSLIPYWLFCVLAVGSGAGYIVPDEFWQNARWDISTAVFAGILTFNGLVLALGWGAFSRIYDVILRGNFGAYLANNNLLNDYLVHINFIHLFQILSICASAVGLVFVLVDSVPLWLDRVVFGATVALTAYGIKQSVDAVTAMNDLVWLSSVYERDQQSRNGSNVAQLSR